MKIPSLLEHIFNPSSRKVGFGYQVFFWATYAFLFGPHDAAGARLLSADNWLICVGIAGALIGGGTIADQKHAQQIAKITGAIGGPNATPDPASPAPAA